METKFVENTFNTEEYEYLSLENLNIKGDDIQKLSVIQGLPQLLQTDPQQTFARIIPKILQELPNSSCEFHIMTSKIFKVLMERQVPINLLHAVLQGIESRDPIVSNAWMETLISVIGVLTGAQLKNEIIPLANCKSLLSQPISSRIASCKILGKLAVHKAFDPTDVKRDVLPLVQSLCQDCHPDVRTAICVQLPSVAQGLGNNLVKGTLLTSLVELASDDNMYVRSASVTAIVQIFPYLNQDIKKATILPLVRQLCERSLKYEDITATTVAKEMGKIFDGLQMTFNVNDATWFLNCYKKLSRRGLLTELEDGFKSLDASMNVACRQHSAANLPVICQFTFALLPAQLELIHSIFKELAADPCYIVRSTLAGCLHEVVKTFGVQSKMLKADFIRLLKDDSEEVLHMLVPQMGNTLELFCQYGTLSRQSVTPASMEIGRAILKCQYELTNGYNWRLLTHFIHQLEHLPNCMPPDFIHQHFTPVILTSAVQGRAKPVRIQAVRTLLVFLRYNEKEMQRRWLRENMVTQLCRSQNCYTRHIFVRLCINAMDIFSEKYFKTYFYGNLLDLADDPVANIRLSVANLFTVLKQMLILPDDISLNTRLNGVFIKYSNHEKDRDVIQIFERKMKEIKNVQLDGVNKEEHDKEQKRRLDEEERIASGGKSVFPMYGKKSTRNSLSKPSSFDLGAKGNMPRSASVPPKSATSQNATNDMSFLEQHFYIDAGINLPTQPLICKPQTVVSNDNNNLGNASLIKPETSKKNIELRQLSENNITDDDKVNMRKLTSNNTSRDRPNKRYSSILSSRCLENNHARKYVNRRSLNLSKDISRIPVSINFNARIKNGTHFKCEYNQNENTKENNDDNKKSEANFHDSNGSIGSPSKNINKTKGVNDDTNEKGKNALLLENSSLQSASKAPSCLPVFIRRSQSEVRK